MAVDRAVWYPWAGLFLLGTAVVGDGGKLFELRCAGFVHLVSVGQYQADQICM